MRDGFIFNVSVVVPGETEDKAWEALQSNPAAYLPEKLSSRIPVTGARADLKAVQGYGKPPELDQYHLSYAEHFGWSRNQKGWWIKADQEEDHDDPKCSVISWGNGWAPRHSACGLLDNAAWGDLRAALKVADEMFYGIFHKKRDHGLCAGCFSDVEYEDIFFHEGNVFCSTGCVA